MVVEVNMIYNPFDLVPIILNGKKTFGRPITFDSALVDHKKMKNAFGQYVKPTQLATTCHDCGQGYIIDVEYDDPPFDVKDFDCPICKPYVPLVDVDPFINPVAAEIIKPHEVDNSLHDLSQDVEDVVGSVADRLVELGVEIEFVEVPVQEVVEELKVDDVPVEESVPEPAPEPAPKPAPKAKSLPKPKPKPKPKPEPKSESKPKPESKSKPAKKPVKKEEKKAEEAKQEADGFIDYKKKRELPKPVDMAPELDLESLEE